MLLTSCRLVLPDQPAVLGWLRAQGGRIIALGAGMPPTPEPDEDTRDMNENIVMPGFIDQHVHGGGGGSYTAGDPVAVYKAIEFHRRHGTTRTLASLVTAPIPELLSAASCLADFAEQGLIEGIHLEGPFSSPERCGAHDSRYLLMPDRATLRKLLGAGRFKVRMVTVAPERPGAVGLIREVIDAGAVAALGHSQATYEQAMAAVDAGAKVATHLFNAMPPLHHRAPGLVGAVLDREEVSCEVIGDPHHLHATATALAFRASKGDVALVTDAISGAGAPDGIYGIGPTRVSVENGGAYREGTTIIAGSTITMAQAVRHAVLEAGVPLEKAAKSAASVPAKVLGIGNDVGAIEVGKIADLVVLDKQLRLVAVFVAGKWLELS